MLLCKDRSRDKIDDLLSILKRLYPHALIVGHRDLNPHKACPCFDAAKEYGELTP